MLEAVGVVAKAERGDMYAIDVELAGTTRRILARRAGRLDLRHIRLLPGDRVRVELSPYDLTRGRVVHRFKAGESEERT
jgi:translation initiation factor IF-1